VPPAGGRILPRHSTPTSVFACALAWRERFNCRFPAIAAPLVLDVLEYCTTYAHVRNTPYHFPEIRGYTRVHPDSSAGAAVFIYLIESVASTACRACLSVTELRTIPNGITVEPPIAELFTGPFAHSDELLRASHYFS